MTETITKISDEKIEIEKTISNIVNKNDVESDILMIQKDIARLQTELLYRQNLLKEFDK